MDIQGDSDGEEVKFGELFSVADGAPLGKLRHGESCRGKGGEL